MSCFFHGSVLSLTLTLTCITLETVSCQMNGWAGAPVLEGLQEGEGVYV